MRIYSFILILFLGVFSSANVFAQSLESDCECDVTITSKNQNFPYNNFDESRDKVVCFKGKFTYKLNWNQLGDNIQLCVGEEVKFESRGLNFEGSKTIYNYGVFDYGQSLLIDEDSEVFNYGTLESKFSFQGGSLHNLNTAELFINNYSDFRSGYLFNDSSSRLELNQSGYTTISSAMTFESLGEANFRGDLDNRGVLILAGEASFDKKLINNNSSVLSGSLSFKKGYVSNNSEAFTEVNASLVVDGDVNFWGGSLEANAGLEFQGKTTMNAGSSITFFGLAKFKDLTLRGELITDFSCNSLEIDKASGYGGTISAKNSSSIYVKKLKDLPNSWNLIGEITETRCGNNNEIVVWLGTVSSDASNDKNWSSKVKNKSSILIPKTPNQPIIDKKFRVFDILIKEGAKLTNREVIELKGELKVEGELSSKKGSISFKGSQAQSISLTKTTPVESLILDNSKGVSLNEGAIYIYDEIKLIKGDLITHHDGSLSDDRLITFKSDSTHTAILSEVENGRIIGNVRVEQFLSKSNRAFRYLSSSVNSKSSILDNWQEGVNNTSNNFNNNKNPNPGYGTHITGNKQGNGGFDATPTGNPSLFSWNINTNSWNAIPNTNQTNLEAGKGYSLLVRGDRSTNIYSNNSAYTGSTTLRTIGELKIGDVDVSDQLNKAPNGFTLIGNPYQAQVDMKKALKESSAHLKQNFYYAWSPSLQTRGGYVTVDLDADPVEYIPAMQGNSPNHTENFRYIQPNQSVFIETANSASEQNRPQLVFKEQHKINRTKLNKSASNVDELGKVDVTLIKNENNQVVDGIRFKFSDHYSNDVNQNDATKVWNNEESFSIVSNPEHYLAIEKRKYPEIEETLKFWIGNYTSQDYTMSINLKNTQAYDVFFIDNYTGQIHKLDANENRISFSVNQAISESKASNRFEIMFEPVTLATEDNQLKYNIQLYPNPSTAGTTYLTHDDSLAQNLDVEVYSLTGRLMEVPIDRISTTEVKLNTASLRSGVYLVKLNHNAQMSTQKLVIN
ncbi:T9SS type A sorting domain-containing protein [Psychroflexus tropicus]|uniref:T9SS type A sorting domain-containing protein n=1 Tax=Psychroflexus tropicus TaxID=197345 RepID=UPI000366B089|nr:T9SS type A sorting domain-containing protein [Psychroflexus tropicus]